MVVRRSALQRSGDKNAPAAPYKHRLAHAASGATSAYVVLTLRYTTGSPPRCGAPSFPHKVLRPCGGPRRRLSGRAFRCVGSLGRSPKPFLHPFVGTKGCPRRVGVPTIISKRPAPPAGDNRLYHTPAGRRPQTFTLIAPPAGDRKLLP